jgi:hypothetical protein
MPRWHARISGALRRYTSAATLLFVAIALFSNVARAGSRYFFCVAMGEARSAPCCQSEATRTPRIDVDCACCRPQLAPGVPRSLLPSMSTEEVVPPPWAVLPAQVHAVKDPRLEAASHAVPPPDRPPRPPDRTRLMVFRN